MAKTLVIAGVNHLPFYKSNSVKIKEQLRKTNVMNFQTVVLDFADAPQQGSEVVFKDGSRFLFAGFISRVDPTETGKGQQYKFNLEVSDYSYIFNSKIARRAYSNMTLKAIAEDLIDTYVGASYGFTTTNIDTGPLIETISFDHLSIRKCFEKLSKLTGYVWWVDYEKNVYFKTQQSELAPETFTDASTNLESVAIAYDTSQVRNSVIVIGSSDGVESLDYITETFTGDGELRSWVLEQKPSTIVHIKLNGATQQYSLDVNERDTDYAVYNFESKSFRLVDASTTPTGGDSIEVRYYPRIDIIEQKTDPASIAFFAALDGGDGVYEYTIKEGSITSLEEASARAIQELAEYSMPLVMGTIQTRTGLLSGGSIFRPGQAMTVNLPTYGLNTDTVFLIQEVGISFQEDGTNTEYFYTLKFGGKIVGVQDFFESLAAQQADGDEVSDAGTIITIEHVTDILEFEEASVTEDIETPPYKWGPGGTPQGKWNLSEWA